MTTLTKVSKKNIEDRLHWLWQNGHAKGIKCNAEKICTIEISDIKDFLGLKTLGQKGQIQFDRWYDSEIFHTVKKGWIVPNELGTKVGIRMSSGGGSAWLEFNPESYNEVKETLIKNGYSIQEL